MNSLQAISIESLSTVTGGAAYKPFKNIPATSGTRLKAELPGVVSAPDRLGWKPFNNIPRTSPAPLEAVMM